MATYYSSPSNQREVTPAYLRDNLCTSYSEAQVLPSNMIQYLNQPSSAASYSGSFPGTSQLQLNPSIGTTASDSPSSQQGYHVWRGDGRNEISFMQPITDSTNMQSGSCREDDISQNMQIRFSDYLLPASHGNNPNAVKGEPLNNLQSPKYPKNIPNSKYLKVAQQLLDEVVNVRKALKQHEANKQQGLAAKTSKENETGMVPHGEESSTNPSQQISPVERQDLHNKITKLVSMLDEVDRRYKQYYYQMHILVSSFDVIAGNGASKPYTALALQTISRQFRCLRDAISGQIKSIRTNLGEQDTTGNNNVEGGISRLRFVDQQLRQQRALQQFGMMQQNAWRPQRGLPETSVSILRAWLFEHFLHPYPKDSDKIMLARQTGLTRGQVANWFINARVRLWKPMIEDMYKEEFGETQMESNSSSDNAPKAKDNIEDKVEELPQNMNSAVTEKHYPGQFQESTAADVTHDAELSRPTTMGDFFQADTHGDDNTINYQRPDMVSCTSLPHDTLVQSDGSGEGRFMDAAAAYQMAELGRFGSHDRVSLTLGLQHFDNTGLPISDAAHHNDFVSMRGVDMYNAAASSMGPNGADFNCLDQDSQRDRFGTSHLLHDFCSLR